MKDKFLDLIEIHQGILHKIISFYAFNSEDKKDLLQEMMVQLWRSFPQFMGKSAFSTWMYKVALNTALLHKRNEKKEILTGEWRKYELITQFGVDKNDSIISLYMAIEHLGPIDKAIALLYLEQKSYQDIEDILGMNKNNIGVRIIRIKEKLKKIFDYEQKL